MSKAIICNGGCQETIISGKILEISGYDGDGETRTLHYCTRDFNKLTPKDFLPKKGETSIAISWEEPDEWN